jgi:hypothetical protein
LRVGNAADKNGEREHRKNSYLVFHGLFLQLNEPENILWGKLESNGLIAPGPSRVFTCLQLTGKCTSSVIPSEARNPS